MDKGAFREDRKASSALGIENVCIEVCQAMGLRRSLAWLAECLPQDTEHLVCCSLQDVQHVDIDYMDRKLDFTLSPSFQNLSVLINQMKTNGMRFILILVGIMIGFWFLSLWFQNNTTGRKWMTVTRNHLVHFGNFMRTLKYIFIKNKQMKQERKLKIALKK